MYLSCVDNSVLQGIHGTYLRRSHKQGTLLKNVSFVQFPQKFYATLKDDPFGNQMTILAKVIGIKY